jgi:hypothetical protein
MYVVAARLREITAQLARIHTSDRHAERSGSSAVKHCGYRQRGGT